MCKVQGSRFNLNADCGMKRLCNVRGSRFKRMRNAECGVRNEADWRVRSAEWGMRNEDDCGMNTIAGAGG